MVPFGFSVGDFIAGISLLIDAVHSLSDTHGAQVDYEELGRQLNSLRNSFECIDGLSLDAMQSAQASTVVTALNDCRLCVDGFVERNSKFKSLGAPSGEQWSLATLKRQGRKVQWALWKKADVAKFRTAFQQHHNAVQMLLASIQVKQSEAQGKLLASAEQQIVEHKNLTGEVYGRVSALSLQQHWMETALEDGKASLAQALENQYRGIRNEVQIHGRHQEKALVVQNTTTMQILTEVESVNSHIGALMNLEKLVAGNTSALKEHMSALIENQQQLSHQLRDIKVMAKVNQEEIPAQALIALLKVRFKDVGLRKVEKGEFALEDSKLKRGLLLTKPWTVIVRPGQHINMSMVFRLEEQPTARCPGCGEEIVGVNLEDVECGNTLCGITYRRIIEEHAMNSNRSEIALEAVSEHMQLPSSEPQLKALDPPENPVNNEMQHYTMLHILTQATIMAGPILATYARPPHDDELYVLKAFARHASRCATCAPPYDIHREGSSLCFKGYRRALDVTAYIFSKAGQTFSIIDLAGDHVVEIEIPADCAIVRELLKALERGLRLRRKRSHHQVRRDISYSITWTRICWN